MNHAHGRIVLDPPALVAGRPAEGDLLVIEEEILVEAPQFGHHPRIHKHAGAGHPVDRPGLDSAVRLVLPSIAREELLADRPRQAGEDADRALGAAVGVAQAEADDARRTVGKGVEGVGPVEHPTDRPGLDLDVWVEQKQPATARLPPTHVDTDAESAIIGPKHEPETRPMKDRGLGNRADRRVVDDHDLARARKEFGLLDKPGDQVEDVGPAVVVDDDDRQPGFRPARNR